MDSPKIPRASARSTATQLLARREHSVAELRRKLVAKGFDRAEIDDILTNFQQGGWLSNERFAESFIRARQSKCYGPLRIRQELLERGVEDGLITAHLETYSSVWRELALKARQKHFGPAIPKEIKERARQARFLQYRGFPAELINAVMKNQSDNSGDE